jgi:hypothetical protein
MDEPRRDEEGYNGWKNRETWNVALWIQNDEGLYSLARECADYEAFRLAMRDGASEGSVVGGIAYETPDGIAWNDSGLDIPRLDEMIRELSE